MAVSWSTIVAKAKRSKKAREADDAPRPPLRMSPRWGRARKEEEGESNPEDPHELVSRFIWTHQQHFDEALEELKRGHKCSCWMWYIFPTPPWIVNGEERGSYQNARYSLRTDEQAKAYLSFIHAGVNLRKNYLEASEAIVYHLEKGKTARQIVGIADEPKLISSWEYFEKMTRDEEDQVLHNIITKGLALIKDPPHKSEAKAAKKHKYGKSIFSASSDEEEPGSASPAPSTTTTTRDDMTEISVSELSSEINRSASEASSVEMACDPQQTLDQSKVEEDTLESKTSGISAADEFAISPTAMVCEPRPSVDQREVVDSTPDIRPPKAVVTSTGASSFPMYCTEVDCFNCQPCSEHCSKADDP